MMPKISRWLPVILSIALAACGHGHGHGGY